jgi:hypothetical protein
MAELAWVTTALSATTLAPGIAELGGGMADGGAIEIGLGLAQRALVVDRPGQLAPQIGVVERLVKPSASTPASAQRRNPELPIFAAHDLDSGSGFLCGRGLDHHLRDFARARY